MAGRLTEEVEMIARYASAITTGTFVTLALLYVMQTLIVIQPAAEVEIHAPDFLGWIHVAEPEQLNRDNQDDSYDFYEPPSLSQSPPGAEIETVAIKSENSKPRFRNSSLAFFCHLSTIFFALGSSETD